MSVPIRAHTVFKYSGEMGEDLQDCVCVRVEQHLSEEDAERLTAHYVERTAAGSSILAAEAKEIAVPILRAFAAAGLGGGKREVDP